MSSSFARDMLEMTYARLKPSGEMTLFATIMFPTGPKVVVASTAVEQPSQAMERIERMIQCLECRSLNVLVYSLQMLTNFYSDRLDWNLHYMELRNERLLNTYSNFPFPFHALRFVYHGPEAFSKECALVLSLKCVYQIQISQKTVKIIYPSAILAEISVYHNPLWAIHEEYKNSSFLAPNLLS